MIVVITHKEINERTGKEEVYVSHGVDTITLENVPLSNERIELCDWICRDPEFGLVVKEGK